MNLVTIGALAHEGKLLWVYCRRCGREKDINPALLPLPGDTPVPDLSRRYMKCSKCGSKQIDTSRPPSAFFRRPHFGEGRLQKADQRRARILPRCGERS
jgi:hypothetical protein